MARPVNARRHRNTLQIVVLGLSLAWFLLPLVAAAVFGFTLPAQGFTLEPLMDTFESPRAMQAVRDTLALTVVSTLGMLLLLVPTIVAIHLHAPRVAEFAESLSVLPLVVPAIALVSGASLVFRTTVPEVMNSVYSLVPLYIVVTMPLCYRALDAGVRALDLRTLFDASSSLGASGPLTLLRVVLPNLRVAMLSASLISVAMLLSEYALASLLLHFTFPVFMVEVGANHPRGAAALSLLTMLTTWGLLALIALASRTHSVEES